MFPLLHPQIATLSVQNMDAALVRLHASLDREVKVLQDVIEKDALQRLKETEQSLKKREQELDKREREFARREAALDKREKAAEKGENGYSARSTSVGLSARSTSDADKRERDLAQREKAVEQREKVVDQREESLKTKARSTYSIGAAKPAAPKKKVEGIRGQRKDQEQKAKKVTKQKVVDWSKADPKKWSFIETECSAQYAYHSEPTLDKIDGSIADGIEYLKTKPRFQVGLMYQVGMLKRKPEEQSFTVIKRTGAGFTMTQKPGGPWRWLRASYNALPAIDQISDPDQYTDNMTYQGKKPSGTQMPGRGMGCADQPELRLLTAAHPRGVRQGAVGDCWLLSAIAAASEFEGIIEKMFKKTVGLARRPFKEFNKYTITLYDVSTDVNKGDWKPVDIVVDERLCNKASDGSLLGCHPSPSGQLWACYLEKAIAAHCGGWDDIDGGKSTHAWRLMFGTKHVYNFHRTETTRKWSCFGRFCPVTKQWEQLANSPKKGSKKVWPMDWPEVGGGGAWGTVVDDNAFFEKMCCWEDNNFIMCAGTSPGSDKETVEGIVQGHAYTVLRCVNDVAGTDFDLIKVRNPWGQGEFDAGKWVDDGDGWEEYPQVKEELKPEVIDNGVFWMEKDEFFQYFPTVYLCALDMSTLQSK
mmetsp:Transcript_120659/g.225455  ORF Transcript_120659/g.225455 Transcript_120659/m.225455 type:complete len:645 (+) Transcript_120659:2-1936(+)